MAEKPPLPPKPKPPLPPKPRPPPPKAPAAAVRPTPTPAPATNGSRPAPPFKKPSLAPPPQPLSPVRLRLGNSSSAGVSAMDATVGVRAVSWNPNERVAFRYGGGEGRVALADADGDVALGWAPLAGFEHAPRTVAAVAFVATAKGVVVDEAVAARVRDRYRRRQQGFKVVVDTHVGVRVGALRTGMVPVRLLCDGGAMAPRGGSDGDVVGPMSKCQVYLFRVRWFSLN
uniref:Late embryogenesis abundant protein LEA-2 subgroup domain-containing protein n=2 Tax=Setaria italica TaxID=4555 RepID=K3YVH3_SETIT